MPRAKTPELEAERRRKISESNKILGKKPPVNYGNKFRVGKKLSEEHKKKIGDASRGKKRPPYSEEWKKKIGDTLRGRKNPRQSDFMKDRWAKMSNEERDRIRTTFKGFRHTKETKEKIRKATFEYAKRVCKILCPRIGRNEREILDKLERELGNKIIRQYEVCGYFLDGFIPELKLAIEVDEKPKDRERDIERQKIIADELNCNFIRIKDYV